MRVYVVYQKDGFGGSEVAEVFSSRIIAREYVIDEIFGKNKAYQNKTENELNNCADHLIYKYVVKPTIMSTENKQQQKDNTVSPDVSGWLPSLNEIQLEPVHGSTYCQYSVIEQKLAILYHNQEKILQAIKLLGNDRITPQLCQ